MLVYISGPITSSGNQFDNVAYAVRVFRALLGHGYAVICPQLTAFADLGNQIPHEVWMACDVEIVSRCDVLLRLPGMSKGAVIEVAAAVEAGVDVCFAPVFSAITVEETVQFFVEEYPLE